MNRWKLHSSPRLQLFIALFLVIVCLVAAVGVSFARYRVEQMENLRFQTGTNAMIFLGCVEEDTFVHRQGSWENQEDQMQIQFAVSNGTSAQEFAQADQQVRLRVIASLGAWSEENTDCLYLTVNNTTYTAAVERITEGSALHTQFGDGWVFRFLDAQGEELSWTLPGGDLRYIPMQLSFAADAITDTSLLQLQAVAEPQ